MLRFGSRFTNYDDFSDDFQILKQLFSSPQQPKANSNLGSFLSVAIQEKWSDAIDFLLEQGARPNTLDLLEAASSGSLALVKLALKEGQKPNRVDVRGRSALRYANSIEVARLLLSEGADPNLCDRRGANQIHKSIATGDREYLDLLLNYGLQVELIGCTPLAFAISSQNYNQEIVDSLLISGANPNIIIGYQSYAEVRALLICSELDLPLSDLPFKWVTSAEGNRRPMSLLHLAVSENHIEAAKSLIRFGATLRDPASGEDTLSIAVSKGSIEMIEALLSLRPDVKDARYELILNQSLLRKNEEQRKRTSLLIDYGFTMKIIGGSEIELLRAAVRLDNLKLVETLLAYDPIPFDGHSLTLAVWSGNKKIFTFILSHYKIKPRLCLDSLKYAVKIDSCDILKIFVENGFNLKEHEKLLHSAVKYESVLVCKFLLKLGFNVNGLSNGLAPLHLARTPNMARLLIHNGACIYLEASDGKTALARANHTGNIDLYETLKALRTLSKISGKLNLSCQTSTPSRKRRQMSGMTTQPTTPQVVDSCSSQKQLQSTRRLNRVLDEAIRSKCNDIIDSLLNRGARPTKITLFEAVANENVFLVNFALQNCPDIDAKNSRGRSALHCAKTATLSEILLSHGADPNVKDRNNITPIFGAVYKCNRHLVETLLNYGASPELKIIGGWTPLAIAMCVEAVDYPIAIALHASGANPNVEVSPADFFKVRALLSRPARNMIVEGASPWPEPSQADGANKINLLHLAVLEDKLCAATILVSIGAQIKNPNNGQTTLSVAVSKSNLEMVKLLLGCAPELEDERHKLILNEALLKECPDRGDIVRSLTDYGFRIQKQDNASTNLLSAAIEIDRPDLVEAQLDWGSKFQWSSLLPKAVQSDNENIMKILLPLAKGQEQCRLIALRVAVKEDRVKMVKSLIADGADFKADKDLLHVAVRSNSFRACRFLLSLGLNPNTIHDGLAPIHEAKNPGMVRLLVKGLASIDIRTFHSLELGKTALQRAEEAMDQTLVDVFQDLLTSCRLTAGKFPASTLVSNGHTYASTQSPESSTRNESDVEVECLN